MLVHLKLCYLAGTGLGAWCEFEEGFLKFFGGLALLPTPRSYVAFGYWCGGWRHWELSYGVDLIGAMFGHVGVVRCQVRASCTVQSPGPWCLSRSTCGRRSPHPVVRAREPSPKEKKK